MTTSENYFITLSKVECVIEKKGKLSYVSWADAWSEVKKLHPDATYQFYENADGFPFWESIFGIDVKVGVTINGIEHISRLPVMDGANKAMKREKYKYSTKYGEKICEAADMFDINKTIQRAFTKAIAMHGIGLYVYRGEDLPEIKDENTIQDQEIEESLQSDLIKTIELQIESSETLEDLKDAFSYAKEIAKDLGQENLNNIVELVKLRKVELETISVSKEEAETVFDQEAKKPTKNSSNLSSQDERMIEDLKKKKEALKSKTKA